MQMPWNSQGADAKSKMKEEQGTSITKCNMLDISFIQVAHALPTSYLVNEVLALAVTYKVIVHQAGVDGRQAEAP